MTERSTTRPASCVVCKRTYQQDLSVGTDQLDFTCGRDECRQLLEQKQIELELEDDILDVFQADPESGGSAPSELQTEAQKSKAFFKEQAEKSRAFFNEDLLQSEVKRFTYPSAIHPEPTRSRDRLLFGVADVASAATRLDDPEALEVLRLARAWLDRVLQELEGR